MRIDNFRVGDTVTNPGGELFKGTRKVESLIRKGEPGVRESWAVLDDGDGTIWAKPRRIRMVSG